MVEKGVSQLFLVGLPVLKTPVIHGNFGVKLAHVLFWIWDWELCKSASKYFCGFTVNLQPFNKPGDILEACVRPLTRQQCQTLIKTWSDAGSQSQTASSHSDQRQTRVYHGSLHCRPKGALIRWNDQWRLAPSNQRPRYLVVFLKLGLFLRPQGSHYILFACLQTSYC